MAVRHPSCMHANTLSWEIAFSTSRSFGLIWPQIIDKHKLVSDLSSLCRTRHLDVIKDIKRQYLSQMVMRQHTTPYQQTGICIGTCNKEKNRIYNIHSLKWNFLFYHKSNLVYTWQISPGKKNKECPHFLQDKLVVLPHWYSKGLFFNLKQLAYFKLKIRIKNFYQSTGCNLTFLDVLCNTTFTLQKKAWLKSICFKHFQA